MNIFMRIIFYVGFLFFGGGFLIAFAQFVVYNGIGNVFEYVKADNAKFSYETIFSNKIEITNIYYSYAVDEKLYERNVEIATSSINTKKIRINEIYYNKQFYFLSYLGDNNLNLRKSKTGMFIMGFFFIIIFSIYKFADMDKWIGVYTRGEYRSGKK